MYFIRLDRLCDELITRPEESYRLWRPVVCDHETSNEEAKARYGAVENTTKSVVTPRKQTNKVDRSPTFFKHHAVIVYGGSKGVFTYTLCCLLLWENVSGTRCIGRLGGFPYCVVVFQCGSSSLTSALNIICQRHAFYDSLISFRTGTRGTHKRLLSSFSASWLQQNITYTGREDCATHIGLKTEWQVTMLRRKMWS